MTSFTQNLLGEIIALNTGFIKTLIQLFKAPDKVIKGYINGLRKRYWSPIRFYLFSITIFGLYLYFYPDSGYFYEEFLKGWHKGVGDTPEQIEALENRLQFFRDYSLLVHIGTIPVFAAITFLLYPKVYNFAEHLLINTYWLAVITLVGVILYLLPENDVFDIIEDILLALIVGYFTYKVHRELFSYGIIGTIIRIIAFFMLSGVINTLLVILLF